MEAGGEALELEPAVRVRKRDHAPGSGIFRERDGVGPSRLDSGTRHRLTGLAVAHDALDRAAARQVERERGAGAHALARLGGQAGRLDANGVRLGLAQASGGNARRAPSAWTRAARRRRAIS